ncbi:DUF4431 domain-containing protein [Stenotrophomonas sp. S39]|uniref:DUF4431 domain-containing protein n=1 Tax=Stenotrophomonas sp. S39 TaxID=2767451 RepID=UPI00190DB0AB|nr:DUF4431 domain-containing protein [Stenotrophomonas sp. S39]MBK0052997.1 DUF4431 domain-containing protein [Stenotrophomonas sp. S39]
MKKITLLFLLIGLLFVSGLHAQTYRYEPEQVSLYGTLVSMPGETADGKKYMYPAIQLFTPISVQAEDEYSPYVGGVLLIQLNLNNDLMRVFQRLKGKQVNMTGTLFHSHTGWHQTPVLITVSDIAESK